LLEPGEETPETTDAHPGHLGLAGSLLAALIDASGQAVGAAWRLAAHPSDSTSRWIGALGDAGRLVSPSPRPLSPLMTDRTTARWYDTIELSTGQMHGAASAAGLTLNDLFVAGILRGLSLYHRRHDVRIDNVRALMPVSTRRPEDPLESNRFVPVRMVLPVDLPNARAYLRLVPDVLRKWKHSDALSTSELFSFVLDRLPAPLTTRAMATMLNGVDFVATDIPGPSTEVYFAGAQVEALYAFAPTAGAALNVALVTTADRLNIGLNIDVEAVPDHAVLVTALTEGFAEVLDAARKSARAV